MSLDARLAVQRDAFDLHLHLRVADGEVVALIGPNGAGKTTVLRCLAGLQPLTAGRVELAGIVVDEPPGTFVPPEQRSVGVVFQQYQLFPHMSALENVAFGLRARGAAASVARAAAADWLNRVGIGDLSRRKPAMLSGGQAQRVALARALAPRPHALLLDEPLAALDATTRVDVRRELRRHLADFEGIAVIVTHDVADAAGLADRLIVVEDGAEVQQGTLTDLAAHPRSAYVAELVGRNIVRGIVRGGVLTTASGGSLVVAGDTADGPAMAVVRPQAVSLHLTQPEGSQRNIWLGTITELDHRGDRVRVRVEAPVPLTAEVTTGSEGAMHLATGTAVWVALKATDVAVIPE